AAGRCAGALTVLRIDAEPIVTAGQPVEHTIFRHRCVELHGIIRIAPQFLGGEVIAILFNLQRFGATTRTLPAADYGLPFDNWSSRVVGHAGRYERRLPKQFSRRGIERDDAL